MLEPLLRPSLPQVPLESLLEAAREKLVPVVESEGRASVESFIAMLRQLPPGVSEVATHPGLVDEQLRALGGGYVDQREVELRVLLEPRVRAALDEFDIALADYSCLARSRRPSATAPPPGHSPGDGRSD